MTTCNVTSARVLATTKEVYGSNVAFEEPMPVIEATDDNGDKQCVSVN